MRKIFVTIAAAAVLASSATIGTRAAQAPRQKTQADLERDFNATVKPFVQQYCASCHSGQRAAAQLNLAEFADMASAAKEYERWGQVADKLTAEQMPPKTAPKQPSAGERAAVIDWVVAMRREEARKHAGDPGIVLARRLSNEEYNNTIRDLTGVDIRPGKEFPVDPSNPAGFDNSGESLVMSPSLMTKYLQAAREVADHVVFEQHGLAFSSTPMLVETDRDQWAIKQIVDFYHAQDTDYSDYFVAAWKFKNRAALGKPKATLASIAAESHLSPKYLATIWQTLEVNKETIGPLAKLQGMWTALPASDVAAAKADADRMRDFVAAFRKKTEQKHADPMIQIKGIAPTSQPFLMYRNRTYAASRMSCDAKALWVEGESAPSAAAPASGGTMAPAGQFDAASNGSRMGGAKASAAPDPDLKVPSAAVKPQYDAAFGRFCAVFPDTFYIQERGRYFPDLTRDTGRLLSAGFHNVMGYFRDDQPLYQLLLDEKQQAHLDEMWRDMDFVASTTARTYTQFFLNESGEARGNGRESEGKRPEDKDITSAASIQQLHDAYFAKAKPLGNDLALKAIDEHFKWVNDTLRWTEKARLDAQPSHVDALLDFAARAYRRPLTKVERDDLVAYYHSLREKDGLSHEDAIRDSLVGVLVSPDFCYRIDLLDASPVAPAKSAKTSASIGDVRPLSDFALASRLSYFLWASTPDAELMSQAAAGNLRKPEVLAAQARRMLKDPKVSGLALEFGGNWLGFRRFEELNTVDRERFTTFDAGLREAMFQEPIRFMEDVFTQQRPVLDFLYANRTFVNPALAKHYGMPAVSGGADHWIEVDDADKYGRGGLLPMAAFLTMNAPGLRTSPVKRGYWVVRQVLGERIPPPPPVVPELPRDEAKFDLPLRDLLAKHRENPMCASCHARFDALGLVFEGYGPVGEARDKDLSGHAVDNSATFPGGATGAGIAGLREYIKMHRQNDFVDNLSRKLLAYALNRSLILSDDVLIEDMNAKLARDGYRFDSLVASIVTSPQFRNKRGDE